MNIQSCEFDESLVEKNTVGSGILPISIDENGKYHILLAKEKNIPVWKGSNKWSGFEGGKKNSENAIETAIREYNEESLGVIDSCDVSKLLLEGKYNIKLVINVQQEKYNSKYHITYLVKIPWQTECIDRFLKVREKLLIVQKLGVIISKLEKFSNIFSINENNPNEHVSALKVLKSETYLHKYTIEENNIYTKKDSISSDEISHRWYTIRKFATFFLKHFSHDAIVAKYDSDNIIYSLSVVEDFLEKEEMKWWDIDTLHIVLRNGGNHENNCFKSFFMPVLQCVLENL